MAIAKYFNADELRCKCGCGRNEMQPETLRRLDELREAYGAAIVLTSAYRCPDHNSANGFTQTHSSGRAVDISTRGKEALRIIELALLLGFTGIGIKQHGDARFVHLDDLPTDGAAPRPMIWSYP